MLIAARVVGAVEVILYVRHEYEVPRQAFERELDRARSSGALADLPPVRVFVSPGGYICGEETALLEALEGKRAEPRNKPPFPGTHGLFGRPTLINNVETFALVPAVLARGAEWYRGVGVNGGIGPKMLALSGDVERPGVYEVPLGTAIDDFIEQYGGGVRGGGRLKAIMPGGPSSGFLPASLAGTPLEFRALAQLGSMLGSGAVIALDETRCMLDAALNVVRFFRNESCGKCVPCRAGSQQLVEILARWQAGHGSKTDVALVEELAQAMADASICGLGQIAPAPIVSALKYWPDEIMAHALEGRCPAGVCM
jgi:NADH:ubiquinone oxidoreductase subunit F (NADH-binding)